MLAAGALALAGVGALSPSAHADYRQIKNYGSGLCVGLNPWESLANGATLVQQVCDGSPAQEWMFVPSTTPGYTRWINGGSAKCMDVRDGKNSDWTPVQQWDCRYSNKPVVTSPQEWQSPTYAAVPTTIKSRIGGRCLDVRGGSLEPGAVFQIYHCTDNNTAQAWTFV
jgi:hypothetical protein